MDSTVRDRKSTRLNSSHRCISYAVFCLKKKTKSAMLQQRHPNHDLDYDPTQPIPSSAAITISMAATLTAPSWVRSFTASFFFNDTATTEFYALSLREPLPI